MTNEELSTVLDQIRVPNTRADAWQQRKRLQRGDRDLLPQLIDALEDEEFFVRKWAVEALGIIGEPSEPVAARLVRIVKSNEERSIRYAASQALGMLGQGFIQMVAALLEDEDEQVRGWAICALRWVNAPPLVIPFYLRALTDRSPEVRSAAMEHIGTLDLPGSLAALEAALNDANHQLRLHASFALLRKDAAHPQALPLTIEGLKDPEANVRYEAACALDRCGAHVRPFLEVLIDTLRHDESAKVRQAILHPIMHLGSAARPAVPALAHALGDADPEVRSVAAIALAQGEVVDDDTAAMVIPGLTACLADEETDVRADAALALAVVGPQATLAVPALLSILKDEDEQSRVQGCAIRALANIASNDPAVYDTLVRQLEKPSLHDTTKEVLQDTYNIVVGSEDENRPKT